MKLSNTGKAELIKMNWEVGLEMEVTSQFDLETHLE